jgi:hypothetical protein
VHKQNRTTTINSKSQAEGPITTNYSNEMKNLPTRPAKQIMEEKNMQNPIMGKSS